MEKFEEVLNKYGIEPDMAYIDEIRSLLQKDIEADEAEEYEYRKVLCIQLFAIGVVNDTLLIWRAKEQDFDAHWCIDVQLLCGAGVEETLKYLECADSDEAREEAAYIKRCENDFEGFSREQVISFYKRYYRIA